MTTPVNGRPVIDAIITVLRSELPSYSITEGEAAPNPADHCPAIVVFADPGVIGGYPFAPGRDLTQSVSLKGIGKSAEQAMRAAIAGRDLLLSGVVTVTGRRVLFTPDDTQQPYPARDDSLTAPLFTQVALLNVRN